MLSSSSTGFELGLGLSLTKNVSLVIREGGGGGTNLILTLDFKGGLNKKFTRMK